MLDIGDHFVGRLSQKPGSEGSHPEAPAWLRFRFRENARELEETLEGFWGWISKDWVRREEIHLVYAKRNAGLKRPPGPWDKLWPGRF